jgi:soluble lytic murein transglycosylase-like protein
VKRRLFTFTLGLATLLGSAWADPKGSVPAKPTALDLQRESIRQQRQSLRQQLGIKVEATISDFEFLTPITPLAVSNCPALDPEEVDSLIADAAKKQSLSPQLIRAVMRQESAFKPCAVSIKGAQGLMQLMPATAAQLHVSDPFDPEQNVQAGAMFLKQLLKKYNGDLRLALVAYNAGSSRADQLDPSQYPAETQGYLANIFAALGVPE